MPNLVVRIESSRMLDVYAYLAGRMLPARWLGLVVAARLRDPAPVPSSGRHSRQSRVRPRILGWCNEVLKAELRRRLRRERAGSESQYLSWIIEEALSRNAPLPDDLRAARSKTRREISHRTRVVRRIVVRLPLAVYSRVVTDLARYDCRTPADFALYAIRAALRGASNSAGGVDVQVGSGGPPGEASLSPVGPSTVGGRALDPREGSRDEPRQAPGSPPL